MVLTRHCCRELARRREPNRARSGRTTDSAARARRLEEIFYVLGGSGLTLLDDKAYEIRAGDCIVYKNFHEAHTIRAGDGGLDVIAFGPREYLGSGELPRGRTMWSITGFVEVQKGHPWDREPRLEWPEPEAARPATIVNVQDVEPQVRGGRRQTRPRRSGRLTLDRAQAHRNGCRHVVRPAARALRRRRDLRRARGRRHARADAAGARRRARGAVRSQGLGRRASAGHGCRACVSRRRVRHGPIAWGTREPNDICWYPRSQKIYWRGVDVVGRIEQLDYWDGEALE